MREYREFDPKTIMVATDFVGTSYGPINYAKQLARRFSAKILLVHVVPPLEAAKGNLPQLMNAAEEELQRRIGALSFDDVCASMIVRAGDVQQVLLNLIAERDADLLVIGTRGERSGSTAQVLLRSASCPVLTVGMHARANAYENTHTRIVLFPADFTPVSCIALAYAESLVKHLGGELLLLHADETPGCDHSAEFGILTKVISDPSIVSGSITQAGRPADVIVSVSAEKHVDFIVMGVHEAAHAGNEHRNGAAFDIIRRVRCPVFTLLAQFDKKLTEAEEFRLQQQRLAPGVNQRIVRRVASRSGDHHGHSVPSSFAAADTNK